MKLRFSILILTCLLICHQAGAITYFVTNNSDSGAGSLRQAITDANASAGLDSVYFNIGDTTVAARSIILLSSLPSLTDHVVIDGITQPVGKPFGNSFAKIQITTSAGITSCFQTEADSCNFYGLFIHNFQYGISISDPYAKIGAIEKGNVIYNCSIAAIRIQGTDHVAIQGNLIGLDTSENILTAATGDGIYVTNSFIISIGGKTYLSYNIISGNNSGVHLDNASYVDFNSNFIGTSISGLIAKPNTYGIRATGLNTNIEIGGDSLYERNVISGNTLEGIYGNFTNSIIQGNGIGVDGTGLGQLGNGAEGIYLTLASSENAIGGIDLFKPNNIAYNHLQAIVFQNSTCIHNTISHNRIFCNGEGGGIVLNFGNDNIEPPQLLIATSSGVAGTTIPNGTVEFFKDDTCINCEGKNFFNSVTAASNGTFTFSGIIAGRITATVTDENGNTSAFAACVDSTIQTCLISGFTAFAPFCPGLNVTFIDQTITAPPTILTSWSWTFGDGNTSTSQSPVHIYASQGTYDVQLITTNSDGCADTVTKSVTIGEAPSAAFTTAPGVCLDQPLSFVDQSTAGSGAIISAWSWNFGDDSTSTLQNPTHTYTATGTFTVTLIVTTNLGCTDTMVEVITVFPVPVASFSLVQSGLQVTFDNTTGFNGPHSSSWDFGDGNTSTLDDPVHSYSSAGVFNACLTIYDSICQQQSIACQVVDLPVGISETNGEDGIITISPNPANSFIDFSVSGIELHGIHILNVMGEEILHFQHENLVTGNQQTIQLPKVASGLYLLKLETNRGIITRKITIQQD